MKLLCACKHSRENVTPEHSWMCFKYFWQNIKFSTKDFTQYFSRSLSWTRDMTFSIASWWFTSGFLPTHQGERMEKSPWKPGGNLPPNCRREQLRYPQAAAAFDGCSTSCAALNNCADLWAPWLPCPATAPAPHSISHLPFGSQSQWAFCSPVNTTYQSPEENHEEPLSILNPDVPVLWKYLHTHYHMINYLQACCYILLRSPRTLQVYKYKAKTFSNKPWWGGVSTICTSWGENSHSHYLDKTFMKNHTTWVMHPNCIWYPRRLCTKIMEPQIKLVIIPLLSQAKRCCGKCFMQTKTRSTWSWSKTASYKLEETVMRMQKRKETL